jgi:hypothetical protein
MFFQEQSYENHITDTVRHLVDDKCMGLAANHHGESQLAKSGEIQRHPAILRYEKSVSETRD